MYSIIVKHNSNIANLAFTHIFNTSVKEAQVKEKMHFNAYKKAIMIICSFIALIKQKVVKTTKRISEKLTFLIFLLLPTACTIVIQSVLTRFMPVVWSVRFYLIEEWVGRNSIIH